MKPEYEHELSLYRQALDAKLRALVDRFVDGPPELELMLRYHLGWVDQTGQPTDFYVGKQLRPLLVLLSTRAAGGDWQKALPAAAAVELVHNFSLVHDDIEDVSPLRRGRPTLWKLWGMADAINAGDVLFALAHLGVWQLSEEGIDSDCVLQVLKVFEQTNLALTRGQHLDMAFERRDRVTVDEYLDMIGGKSAALIALAMQIGALVAGLTSDQARQYACFGQDLGLAFQIQDDILGIWGDPEVMGKSAVTDIMTKKKSLPVLFGLMKSPELVELYAGGEFGLAEVDRVMVLLAEVGAQGYARSYVDRYFVALEEGYRALSVVDRDAGLFLRSLVFSLMGRSF